MRGKSATIIVCVAHFDLSLGSVVGKRQNTYETVRTCVNLSFSCSKAISSNTRFNREGWGRGKSATIIIARVTRFVPSMVDK